MKQKPILKVCLLDPKAKIPSYAHNGDAGLDLFTPQKVIIKAGERVIIDTKIAMEIPEGTVALIWDKSGLAIKHGIKILGGVFDYGYRGSYTISLINLSKEDYTFEAGDKIAQVLIQPVITVQVVESDIENNTSRGEGRMGSTGK